MVLTTFAAFAALVGTEWSRSVRTTETPLEYLRNVYLPLFGDIWLSVMRPLVLLAIPWTVILLLIFHSIDRMSRKR